MIKLKDRTCQIYKLSYTEKNVTNRSSAEVVFQMIIRSTSNDCILFLIYIQNVQIHFTSSKKKKSIERCLGCARFVGQLIFFLIHNEHFDMVFLIILLSSFKQPPRMPYLYQPFTTISMRTKRH